MLIKYIYQTVYNKYDVQSCLDVVINHVLNWLKKVDPQTGYSMIQTGLESSRE